MHFMFAAVTGRVCQISCSSGVALNMHSYLSMFYIYLLRISGEVRCVSANFTTYLDVCV